MPTTSLGIRYPVLSDTANVPRDLGYLASDVDTILGTYETAWAAYTPAWTAATTNPTIGNGNISGRYQRIGKIVTGTISIAIGSTTTVGSGQYYFSLPVAPRAGASPAVGWGGALVGGTFTTGICRITGTSLVSLYIAGIGNPMLHNSPGTLIAGGWIEISFAYEAA